MNRFIMVFFGLCIIGCSSKQQHLDSFSFDKEIVSQACSLFQMKKLGYAISRSKDDYIIDEIKGLDSVYFVMDTASGGYGGIMLKKNNQLYQSCYFLGTTFSATVYPINICNSFSVYYNPLAMDLDIILEEIADDNSDLDIVLLKYFYKKSYDIPDWKELKVEYLNNKSEFRHRFNLSDLCYDFEVILMPRDTRGADSYQFIVFEDRELIVKQGYINKVGKPKFRYKILSIGSINNLKNGNR